ncbi:MAG: DUF6033 family protein [Defluviitaleaceae bacterium]|nr:DUF6033 family protein [Defluviitaleaceae bacterium]MCL2262122.1 DUF6033 family protein [Defluviitaleaceae bacterium]
MGMVNLGGLSVTESSYRRARQIVDDKPRGERKSANEVLNSLREMMPGWNISTSSSNWGEGARNIEISADTLERMARDPEAMVRYKALILDLEDAVPALEEWKQQNPGRYLEFGLSFEEENTRAIATIRTLMGEDQTEFDLPNDKSLWAELITQKLNSLNENLNDNPDGSQSWIA